ncbi:MAG: hypothetical protein ACK4E8_00790 [Lacibacter sp.]
MKRFLIAIPITAIVAYAAGLYLPWWGIAPAAFIVTLVIPQRPVSAFFSGFLGVAFAWAAVATYLDAKNQHLLSSKIAQLLIKSDSYFLLLLITVLVGGITGGLAALCASFLGKKKPAVAN